MIDNNFKGTPRQYAGALIFRLFIRRRFSAVWVPGSSGRRLLQFLGMPGDLIREGVYGADPKIFYLGPPIYQRPKEIVYVGQLIPRKGVAALVEAFRRVGLAEQGWILRIIGDGPMRGLLTNHHGVRVEGFHVESEVAAAMRNARLFVLPSYEEHWGVVLAEAALSGCVLAASRSVGAASDLINEANGLLFAAGNVGQIRSALEDFTSWPQGRQRLAQGTSRKLGENFGPDRWSTEFGSIIGQFSKSSSSA
jgi:glycosyltransferase involved in cell wall biosynthesis